MMLLRLDKAVNARRDREWRSKAGQGGSGSVGQVVEWTGKVRLGTAVKARCGGASIGLVRRGTAVKAGQGLSRWGGAWNVG